MNKVTGTAVTLLSFALAVAGGASPAGAQAAFGPVTNKPTPALADFSRSYRAVRDYMTTAVVFEQSNDGKAVESRTYAYKVVPPNAAIATIAAGPGNGTATAWGGGGVVTLHEPARLAGIRLTVPIDDPRVQTLRGDTLDTGTFTYDLQYMLATPGTLVEAAGPTVGGAATRAVTLTVKDPAVAAVTKVELDLSTTSHLPVRRQSFVGKTVVKTETFSNTKVNLGLRTSDLQP